LKEGCENQVFGISMKLFEISDFYDSIVQFEEKVESCQNLRRLQ
jgi:hypothetical protein